MRYGAIIGLVGVLLVIAGIYFGNSIEGTRLTPHSPIYINGDSDFTPANGVVGGNGTADDPYIISGWDIDASGYDYGIYIGNTTKHFIVKDCVVYNAGTADIYIYNATNGTVTSCSVHNSGYGIYIKGDIFCNVMNNSIVNVRYGITLSLNSQYCTISNNSLSNIMYIGIGLYSSTYNTIRDNTIIDAGLEGMYLGYTSVSNNICCNKINGNNNGSGIYISGNSDVNYIENNTIENLETFGIKVLNCNGGGIGFFKNNTIRNSSQYGIYMMDCTGYLIEGNNIVNCSYESIYINGSSTSASGFIIKNNEISQGCDDGIYLYNATNCQISGNYIHNMSTGSNYMIYTLASHITISENVLENSPGRYGIYINGVSPHDITISSNIIKNVTTGMYIGGHHTIGVDFPAYQITVYSNKISDLFSNTTLKSYGIYVYLSHNITVRKNNITNANYGVYMKNVWSSSVSQNDFWKIFGLSSSSIYLYYNSEVSVTENGIHAGVFGLWMYSCDNITIERNVYREEGSAVISYGNYISTSENITFKKNTIDSIYRGLYGYKLKYSEISYNDIGGCRDYGITLDSYSHHNTITRNDIYECQAEAIYLDAQTSYNAIVHNNFWYNNGTSDSYNSSRPQAADFGSYNSWYDSAKDQGNFWADLTSPDNDHDGIVDNPYNIGGSAGSNDAYPLTYRVRDIIKIESDDDFTSENGVIGGSGTSADPYIIERWHIDADGYNYGIYIANTTKYFVVKNCLVKNADDIDIYIYNASHGKVEFSIVRASTSTDSVKIEISSDVSIENSYIKGYSLLSTVNHGIIIQGSSNINIQSTEISQSYYGIMVYSSSDIFVADVPINTFVDYGIYLYQVTSFTLSNVSVDDSDYSAIYFDHSSSGEISGGTMSNAGDHGFYLSYCSWITISSTTYGNDKDGVHIENSNNITIDSSEIYLNTFTGINIYKCDYIEVTQCHIHNNSKDGIRGLYANHTTIIYNKIENNTLYGAYLSGSYGGLIHHNNFYYNHGSTDTFNPANVQAYDDTASNQWDNGTEGNFWRDWTSPDNNGDGIVDNPYILDGGADAQDRYPLAQPYVSELQFIYIVISLGVAAGIFYKRFY